METIAQLTQSIQEALQEMAHNQERAHTLALDLLAAALDQIQSDYWVSVLEALPETADGSNVF